ncbi:hypothetical protein BAU15_09205 [Enterococcus sp. JM4C]|uniref:nucleotidyltransferase n=1 Tax=Candidatus Enterococcus huntleyi TaxID=1857217 RepID=UPI0013799370|nr:nucleotidyltransferase [Enterococcus sp. JM4C]KAF1296812.1 hypothetical protein BAU15_09205 [Enterococcus sp. JM4C]
MQACGVVVEYNPFHNGHLYHLKKAREVSQADIIIAVMSGNFLQRGEPAIFDKWLRANEALQNGADLVIELPVEWAVQSADYFAKGAIQILQELACESLCFGTDSTASFDYEAFGLFVKENPAEIEQTFQSLKETSLSYAQKMTEVFQTIYPDMALDFSSPNHILGLSYAKENALYNTPMTIYPIRREGAEYHESQFSSEKIASATAIRKAKIENKETNNYVPRQTQIDLFAQHASTWADYWPYLRYKILSTEIEELRQVYQMTEGLEYRLKKAAVVAENFEQFIDLVKSKRYTQTRLQRLACYILLNIKAAEIEYHWQNPYLHVLGFTKKGQDYLKEKKKSLKIPLVSKIGKNQEEQYPLLIRSDKIYQMGINKEEQNFGRFPLRVAGEKDE